MHGVCNGCGSLYCLAHNGRVLPPTQCVIVIFRLDVRHNRNIIARMSKYVLQHSRNGNTAERVSDKAERVSDKAECVSCGKEFVRQTRWQEFCCRDCREAYNRELKRDAPSLRLQFRHKETGAIVDGGYVGGSGRASIKLLPKNRFRPIEINLADYIVTAAFTLGHSLTQNNQQKENK